MDSSHQLSEKERFFVDGIMKWGKSNVRKFIWREKNDDFFTVFVAEFLLRKTRSETVDRFLRDILLKKFKTFCDIANEDEDELRRILKPLGLHNQRAIALKKNAYMLCKIEDLPTGESILELPHCGRYIANAVECFFYKKRKSIVDHNIQRVLNRFFSLPEAVEIHKANYLWEFAEKLMPNQDYLNYNYYLLDFAALVCKPRKPDCSVCPLSQKCDFYTQTSLKRKGEINV